MTVGRSLFSLLPPVFTAVPQYLDPNQSCTPAPLRTGQADFPYIRLLGDAFSKPPRYETDLGLYGCLVLAIPHAAMHARKLSRYMPCVGFCGSAK